MANGWTNKGARHVLGIVFRSETAPTNYYVALCTSANTPDADTNTMSDLTQVSTGNGYTDGGYQLTANSTDFDTITEDDTANEGLVQIKDLVWTASGGTLPASNSARWAVLTDDDGTVANREVYAYWDLSSDRQVSSGQTLTLEDLELSIAT